MNLKIKLENPKQCLGCPYAEDYFIAGIPTGNYRCKLNKNYKIKTHSTETVYIPIRPKKCIKKNGE